MSLLLSAKASMRLGFVTGRPASILTAASAVVETIQHPLAPSRLKPLLLLLVLLLFLILQLLHLRLPHSLVKVLFVPTPINTSRYSVALSDYDPILRSQLVSGFSFGFDFMYRGTPTSDLTIRNHKSTFTYSSFVSQALEKELTLGRIAGPFVSPPFPFFQLSPLGAVPKKTPGSFRLIFDLSFPQGSSVNDHISDVFSEVSYVEFSEAIRLVSKAGPGAFLAKTDIKEAYRLLPVHPSLYHVLCFSWQGLFYYDRCLAMGLRSACQLFEKFSCSLNFIAKKRGIDSITHYLDDFLIINPTETGCSSDLSNFTSLCEYIGVPLAPNKTVGPSQVIDFLGLQIDTVSEQVLLPKDKLDSLRTQISALLSRRSCTLAELQSILGSLNFACRVVLPGRAFLRRLYHLTCGITKPFHHIRLRQPAKEDLKVWLSFLEKHNGITFYREELFLSPDVVHIHTDACKSVGYGGTFDTHWFSQCWPSSWWSEQNITLLELVPIVLALDLWAPFLTNRCVIFHSDNMSVVACLNAQSSKERLVMSLIRRFVLRCLSSNILFKSQHIPGFINVASDLLSRSQLSQFRKLFPDMDSSATQPQPLPHSLSSENNQMP